ncbi:MAG: hypothetical protein HKN68_02725 [Saprospiraceae bacterium]|nr:hypothetical protein [Saprospiraceae bacterium]
MKYFYYILGLFILPVALQGQSVDTQFGKNRVQFHDDFKAWDKYETENFVVYWYGKARNVARAVVPIAEYYHDEVQNILEHRMNDKIEILVYTDISDLNQSNIGNDDTWTSKSGETKIVGNKMFVYFDGDHQHLRVQLREGIASVYMSSILFGSNFQEIVQNAVLLHLPDWYKLGIISYAGSNWDYLIEDELRDLLQRKDDYWDFEKLADEHPRAAGHSMWYFISQYYSPSSIPNLLYLTKISRDLRESFLYVLSENRETVYREWERFFREYFNAERDAYKAPASAAELDLKNKPYVPISKLRMSPDGSILAYAYNDIGKYRLVVRNMESGEEKTIFKYGFKNAIQETDYNYPLVAWHPNNQEISIIYEHRDIIYLRRIQIGSGEYIEQIIPEEIQRIYSLSIVDDENYVFSASTDGYSDLYEYDAKFRTVNRISNDFYDDLDAHYVTYQGRKGILFSSNRTDNFFEELKMDTILPLDNFDIFFYDLEKDNKVIERLTETPKINERNPFLVGNDEYISYLADQSGIINTYALDPLSGRGYSISNLDRNIIIHHGIINSDQYIYSLYRNGAYRIYIEEKDWSRPVRATYTPLQKILMEGDLPTPLIIEEPEDRGEMKDEYMFVTEFEDPEVIPELKDNKPNENIIRDLQTSEELYNLSDKPIVELRAPRVTASRIKFRIDNFTTKLDNQVLFEGLESYTGEPNQLDYNPTGLLLKATIKDLLEDYSIEGGVRIPTTFDGTEYFLVFDDKKKLIDKRYAIYRKTNTDFSDDNVFPAQRTKKNALLGMFQLRYPFDIYRSLRLTSTLRFDKYYFQATENQNLNEPFNNEKRLGLKLEYVYDNTIDIDENLKHGTRYKAWVEAINQFNFELSDGFNVDFSTGFTTVIGVDFRHYIPFLEHSIIAFRAAGSTSLGSDKILYYLGGVNGWVFQRFNEATPVPDQETFAFKTAANQLRGFKLNIRNGGSFGLVNTEIRFPLFKYLKGRNIRSSFLRNFQLVLFYDAGLAWHGVSPFSERNPLNTQVISSPPVIEVEVDFFRDPLVMGYGAGLRAKLLGYHLKLDYAWGIETRKVTDGIFYFALGTDF